MNAKVQDAPAWVTAVSKAKDRFIKQAALHGSVEWDSEASYIRQAFQSSPQLRACTQASIVNAIELIGSIGISTSPLDKLAFLQATNVKLSAKDVKPEVWEAHATLKIQFTGLIKIAVDSGAAKYIRADVVRAGDSFAYNGPASKPDFRVENPFSPERAEVIGAFAEAQDLDGTTYCEILRLEELAAIKKASKTGTYGPWVDFVAEMYKKAAIRRLYKTIPKNNARLRAASRATAVDDGFDISQDNAPEPREPTYTATHKEQFDNAMAAMDKAELWHLSRSSPDGAWLDLHGSYLDQAPKGKKGEFRKRIDTLTTDGRDTFVEGATQLLKAMEADDENSGLEIMNDFEDQHDTLKEQIENPELLEWINTLSKAA